MHCENEQRERGVSRPSASFLRKREEIARGDEEEKEKEEERGRTNEYSSPSLFHLLLFVFAFQQLPEEEEKKRIHPSIQAGIFLARCGPTCGASGFGAPIPLHPPYQRERRRRSHSHCVRHCHCRCHERTHGTHAPSSTLPACLPVARQMGSSKAGLGRPRGRTRTPFSLSLALPAFLLRAAFGCHFRRGDEDRSRSMRFPIVAGKGWACGRHRWGWGGCRRGEGLTRSSVAIFILAFYIPGCWREPCQKSAFSQPFALFSKVHLRA